MRMVLICEGGALGPDMNSRIQVLVYSLVRPRRVEVIENVLTQDPASSMVLAENHDVIEALVAGVTEEPFHDGIAIG